MTEVVCTEIWKDVEGFPRYQVSNLGRVARWIVSRNGYYLPEPERKILKPTPNGKGYLRVFLCRDNKVHSRYLHRIVAAAFIGPPPADRPQVNHKDAVKSNCRVDNLEYVDHRANNRHAAHHRLFKHGSSHYMSSLTDEQVYEIRDLAAQGFNPTEIARRLGYKMPMVRSIVKRVTWKYLPERLAAS